MLLSDIIDRIICGDALEVLKKIPQNSIDLIITSPPYNVGMNYETYDDVKDYQEYLDYMKNVLKECYRILVKGGRIAINLPSNIMAHRGSKMAYLALDFVLIMRDCGFLDREWIGWVKMIDGSIPGKSTGWGSWMSPSNPALRDGMEYIIVMDKETHKKENVRNEKSDITSKEFLKFTTNVWVISPEVSFRDVHPAPFPEELPYRLIKSYSYPNDVILDPFCGVGTTCAVAKKLNRRFIGIDIDQKYCEIAKVRVAQGMLFNV